MGKVLIVMIPVLCLFAEILEAESATKGLTIKESAKFCEAAVPKNCVDNTCPKYCDSIRSAKLKASCKKECTIEKRCKLKPAVGSDDPNNQVLDAQNRDQLHACIAEKRDPAGTSTGRRMTPWVQLETESYKKAIGTSRA